MEHFVWNADPVLLSIGPLTIHWYGALFAGAIFAGLYYMKWLYSQEGKDPEQLDTLLMYVVVGIILGARLGHCLFYEPEFYLSNPVKILAIWEGGLASHGGGLGAIIGAWLYCRRHQVNIIWLLDRLGIATAVFGVFVRSANFVNSEILGHPTNAATGIVFERIDNIARHPAQLYEAFSYLLIALILTWVYRTTDAKSKPGFLFGLFLILTFTARFIIEFFKEKQAAYSLDIALNTGQLLSIPFLLVGLFFIAKARSTNQ